MQPWINVTDPPFNAKADGVTSADESFQKALDPTAIVPNGEHPVIVPPGTYRIDGSLEVFYQLHILPGATLVRTKKLSDSIEPLIFLSNREASLIGGGRVVSENDSPRGVVSVGSRDLANKRQVTLTRIDGIKIQGAGTTDSVGLNLDSLEPVTGDGTGANYMGSFSNIVIQNVGTGVRIGKLCNGRHILFYLLPWHLTI